MYNIEGSEPNLGDTGTFIINENAVNPFEIVSIQKIASTGDYEVVGYDGLQKISYYPLKGIKGDELIPHEQIKNAFYVPGNSHFVKLSGGKMHKNLDEHIDEASKLSQLQITVRQGNKLKKVYPINLEAEDMVNHISNGTDEYLPKNASFIKLGSQIEVSNDRPIEKLAHHCGRDNVGFYYFSGPVFDKYAKAHEIRNLSKNQAMWTLIHCNGSDSEVEKLGTMKSGDVLGLRSSLRAPSAVKTVAKSIQEKYASAFSTVKALKHNLVKEAAALEDKTTVDAVLSLNLINKENIMDYVTMAPQMEKVASDLAQTLLTIRLGLSNIPEGAVKTAMLSLAHVASNLRQLGTVISETR